MAAWSADPLVLPKLPRQAPTAQLTAQVLLSGVLESKGSGPRRVKGASVPPRRSGEPWSHANGGGPSGALSAREFRPQLKPPRWPAEQGSTAAAATLSGSSSARGRPSGVGAHAYNGRVSSLSCELYKGDCVHHLNINEDDSVVASTPCETPVRWLDGCDDILPAGSSGKPVNSSALRSGLPPIDEGKSAACRRRSEAPPREAVNMARLSRLRACFRIDAEEIAAAYQELHRFKHGEAGAIQDTATAARGYTAHELGTIVRHFISEFGRTPSAHAQLKAQQQQPKTGRQTFVLDERRMLHYGKAEDGDFTGGDSSNDVACIAEVYGCMKELNFVRWLCGLHPVRLSSSSLAVCDMVSQLLGMVPTGGHPHRSRDLVPLVDELIDALAVESTGKHFAVLHKEGSLMSAIKQSLSSTHMLCTLSTKYPALEQSSRARSLAFRVEAEKASAEVQKAAWRAPGAATRRAPAVENESSTAINAQSLPEDLEPLRVFWELSATPEECHQGPASSDSSPRGGRSIKSEGSHAPKGQRSFREKEWRHAAWRRISPVWGDRHGALSFRRLLLNPALKDFGACRREDTCILWTGADAASTSSRYAKALLSPPSAGGTLQDASDGPWSCPATGVGAVCFPPAGIVPLNLLEGGRTVWSIAPDSSRFQPGAKTGVQVWRVRIDKPPERQASNALQQGAWGAERVVEVPVRNFAVDCTSHGEPFCVLFAPELGQPRANDQLEVVLYGLVGPVDQLHFFYELQAFRDKANDHGFYSVGLKTKALLSDPSLWQEPQEPTSVPWSASLHPSDADEKPTQATASAQRNGGRGQTTTAAGEPTDADRVRVTIETVSHHKLEFTVSAVNLDIMIRSPDAAALDADLVLVRYGGDEEVIPGGAQIQKLGTHYIVRTKLPMPHSRYELRFFGSLPGAPGVFAEQPLRYIITTSDSCQTLLASLEDSLVHRFGYAKVTPEAQRFGLQVLEPILRRVDVGQAYFLVRVDKSQALEAARRLREGGDAAVSSEEKLRMTSLFSHRLQPKAPVRTGVSHGSEPVSPKDPEANILWKKMHDLLGHCSQDCDGRVHLEISMEHLQGCMTHRLRERPDFPGFFEGLVTFKESDSARSVQLLLTCPGVEDYQYRPLKAAEWAVFRADHYPIGF